MPWKPKVVSVPKDPKIVRVKPFHKTYSGELSSYNTNAPQVQTHEWVKGWYEHIDTYPVHIDSKEQLARECAKRGSVAKALIKRKSQGKGVEHAKR